MPLAPKAPGARSAPDEFLSICSSFHLISDPPVRSGCSAQPGGPSLSNRLKSNQIKPNQIKSGGPWTAQCRILSKENPLNPGSMRNVSLPYSHTNRPQIETASTDWRALPSKQQTANGHCALSTQRRATTANDQAHPGSSATKRRDPSSDSTQARMGRPTKLGRQMHRHRYRSTLQHQPNGMPVE